MDDILRLPRYELVTQFKCIEGWSQIVHWAGVRMADFLEEYPPESRGWQGASIRLHGDARMETTTLVMTCMFAGIRKRY